MHRSIATHVLGLSILAAGCDLAGQAQQQSGPQLQPIAAPSPGDLEPADTNPPQVDDPPAKPSPSAKEQKPATTRDDRLYDKTFDDIKFDIEPDAPYLRSMLTDKIEALNGLRMKIRGYILPTPQSRGIKQFVLVRDNMECCFGPGAALYDCILIEMLPDQTAKFTIRPVSVTGRFEIKEFIGPDGRPLAIYRMDGEKVE